MEPPLTTLLLTHPACLGHDAGAHHPESPVRLRAVISEIERMDAFELLRREAPRASEDQLGRVHPIDYVRRILDSVPREGHVRLDPDTALSPGSGEAALRAAGAVCAAVDAVVAGEVRNAFCATRPPGHHAMPARAMGFCVFSNVAIGAAHARAVHGLRRLAIADFDVHHGNGTEAAVWNDPDTLYCSIHQAPLYPGTGARAARGAHGNIVNLPVPAGTASARWRTVVEREMLPAIEVFAPEMVLVSAGFDAHRADPLAGLELVEDDFRWITSELMRLAERHAHGRVVSTLEGGYDPRALARSVCAHLDALLHG